VLTGGRTHERAIRLGQQLIATIEAPYDLGDGLAVRVGVSVGISMAPEHGSDFVDLLAVADAALYQAKSSGKSRCCMASPKANAEALRRLQGETGKSGGRVEEAA
jgi:diguanylate cyclase